MFCGSCLGVRSEFTGQVVASLASHGLHAPLQAAEAAAQLGVFGVDACMYQGIGRRILANIDWADTLPCILS